MLNSATASALTLSLNGGQLELQIPHHSIRSVKMYSNRSGVVFTEFRQSGVKDLWKSVNVDFKHPAKATLSSFQSSPQTIEILVASPPLNASVCYGDNFICDNVQIVDAAPRVNQSSYKRIG